MRRIGITQRVEVISSYGETRDCLDQQWTRLISLLGWVPIPLGNSIDNVEVYLETLGLDGIIFSGGNDLATFSDGDNVSILRDEFEEKVLRYCSKKGIPVLGVCRGAQMIASLYGGELRPIKDHIACRHGLSAIDTVTSIISIPETVNSFHGFGIKKLDPTFEILAKDSDGNIEAFKMKNEKIYGIMWHPEREIPFLQEDIITLKRIFDK